MEELCLSCGNENFNLEHLFIIAGKKLMNLRRFILAEKYALTVPATKILCEKLRDMTPNLELLNVKLCNIHNEAFSHIATLPLVQLHTSSLSFDEVMYLCNEKSKLKETIKVLCTGRLSDKSYRLILTAIPQIEEIDCFNRDWFIFLLIKLDSVVLNLQKLTFRFSIEDKEEEMKIAALMCPKLKEIHICSTKFTQKMIKMLSNFKCLSILKIEDQFDSGGEEAEDFDEDVLDDNDEDVDENTISVKVLQLLPDEICGGNFSLPNLVEFTLTDQFDKWISPGHLITFLDMCPNIEKLRLDHCAGFSNKVAAEFSKLMWYRKLKHLVFHFCNLLQVSGYQDMIRIPSLSEMEIHLEEDRFNSPYAEQFQKFAETNDRKTVILRILCWVDN